MSHLVLIREGELEPGKIVYGNYVFFIVCSFRQMRIY